MKNLGIILLLIALLTSCEKMGNSLISDGYYQGYFNYQNVDYWCLICFENGKYVEWPSGGARFQKDITCLTTGTYSVKGILLSFELETYKFSSHDLSRPRIADMVLPGRYIITNASKQDTLIFKRGTGVNQIIYYLKMQ